MSGYQEIASKIRDLIDAGEYLPGDVLPKQDDIAASHSVNIHTVRKAVDLLASEGYVRPIRRRGTVVLDRAKLTEAIARLRAELADGSVLSGLGLAEDVRTVLEVLAPEDEQ